MKLLISTWQNGLFVLDGDVVSHELAGHGVRGLTAADEGCAIAVLGGDTLGQRSSDGVWRKLARSDAELSVCLNSQGDTFVGTDANAGLLRLVDGRLEAVSSFNEVLGRESWYAGTAIVNGKVVGPPLGVRSMSATIDGSVLFANVHVGGIPRSTDRGSSWRPTIEIDSDVHQVACSPLDANVVVAAAAVGVCMSHDAGENWVVETDGLHEPHCLAAAFIGDEVFVSASADPFSEKGAVYRRPIGGGGPFAPVGNGFPRWTTGVVDTACIAVKGANAAIVDAAGSVYVSSDMGCTWSPKASGLTKASAAVFV